MSKRQVVITGLGCITALGETVDSFFKALCEGKSGISAIESFDTAAYPVHFGGEIKQFDPTKYIDFRESKRMDRFSQFAVSAAKQAVAESGLDFAKEDPYRMGAIVATGIGGIKEIEEQHTILLNKAPMRISPFTVPRLMANAAAGNIAIQYGLRGPNFCVSSACASSNHAIGEAFCNIVSGRSDVIITGGTEAALTPVGLASFCAARSLSQRNDNPPAASRPFDKDRDGFVLAEGAGFLKNTFNNASQWGIRMEDSYDNLFDSNSINPNFKFYAVECHNCHDNRYINNFMTRGMRFWGSCGNSIGNNSIYSIDDCLRLEHGSSFNDIAGNDIGQRPDHGVADYGVSCVSGSDNNIISLNSFNRISWISIDISESSRMEVNNNIFFHYSGLNINIYKGKYVNIYHNTMKNTDGISVENSMDIEIVDNMISELGEAISFIDVHDSKIIRNYLYGNEIGIWLEKSSSNIISCNEIGKNENAFYVQSSSFNKIYLNTIVDNDKPFYSDSDIDLANYWDFERTVGNYWSDYSGSDIDGDGIGDTDLPHNGVDLFPLIYPVECCPIVCPCPTTNPYGKDLALMIKALWNCFTYLHDVDCDGDGIPYDLDDFPLDKAAWKDFDGDGRPDELNGTSISGLELDLDSDNDGILNGDDDFPFDENKSSDDDGGVDDDQEPPRKDFGTIGFMIIGSTILVFALLVGGIFLFLRRRRKKPSIPRDKKNGAGVI